MELTLVVPARIRFSDLTPHTIESRSRASFGERLAARRTVWARRWWALVYRRWAERKVRTTMNAPTQCDVDARTLVSVILPTRNRSALLPAAIASVQAQLYRHWELVVVDDGSDDDTWDYLRSIRDERVRCLRIERAGVSAARNSGLAAARGALVAYLDDDNRLHPGWLQAVAFAFAEAPQSNVVYGARLIGRTRGAADETEPRVDFVPFSRRRLRTSNLIDVGVLAHRAGLPEARFDESFQTFADWDLVLRLTASERPLALPVIACHYSTSAPSRLSTSRAPAREFALIRQRIHRRP